MVAADDEHWPDGNIGNVSLPAFKLSFAPVTYAEYACFVEAGGYENPKWWEGADAQRWFYGELENEEEPRLWRDLWRDAQVDSGEALTKHYPDASEHWQETSYKALLKFSENELEDWLNREFGAQKNHSPRYWTDPDYSAPMQPVVGVSWFEARAYCAWLSVQTGEQFRLPAEFEWEAAARGLATAGQSGRLWPWGDSEPTHLHINADSAHLRKTSPVGVFPESDTPEGICDMAGNVWEWCSDSFGLYSSNAGAEREQHSSGGARVLRGGSWICNARICRSAYRSRGVPSGRFNHIGFRFAQVTQAPAGAERPTGKSR